jgi:hypothetical protein
VHAILKKKKKHYITHCATHHTQDINTKKTQNTKHKRKLKKRKLKRPMKMKQAVEPKRKSVVYTFEKPGTAE